MPRRLRVGGVYREKRTPSQRALSGSSRPAKRLSTVPFPSISAVPHSGHVADMAEPSRPDICIVGAGALGIALAQHARALGAAVLLVDRGIAEPGDATEQSLRLASLQASAARAHAIRGAGQFGINSGAAKISMRAVQERAHGIGRSSAPLTSRDSLTALGIDVVRGETRFADPNSLLIGDMQYRPRSIILATGAIPVVPTIPGLDQIDFFTPDTILDNTRKLTHLLVLGDDEPAYVLAQAASRLGAEVTLVPQGRALTSYDRESADILLDTLRAEGVRILDGSAVTEIVPRTQGIGAVVSLPDGEVTALDLSHVLVATGRVSDLSGLDIEVARWKPQHAHYAAGGLGETTNRRIRVVGPAAGITQWQHGLRHGKAVIEAIVLGRASHAVPPSPKLVMTDPPLAQIGQLPATDAKLRPGHHLYRESFVENAQARASGQGGGLAKLVINAKGQIVGAALVGPAAPELAAVLAVAMERGIPASDLASLSLPSPSLFELLVRMGQRHKAGQAPSAWAQRIGSLRRSLRI